jgi:hypothetical protein
MLLKKARRSGTCPAGLLDLFAARTVNISSDAMLHRARKCRLIQIKRIARPALAY